jgi:hypothetical protein
MVRSNRRIVCLCGSTRFYEAFAKATHDEALAGRIVLSVACFSQRPDLMIGIEPVTPDQKRKLDELHLDKIALADEVLILNVDGYIGESTKRELAYAITIHKPARFLVPAAGEKFMEDNSHELGAMVAEFVTRGSR